MVTLLIIRHGFSLGNKQRIFTGQLDVPLDDAGRAQARSIADYILQNFHVDGIYTSDLSRACDTVMPIAKALGLPVVKTPSFREINEGNWQGMTFEELAAAFPVEFTLHKENPSVGYYDGGENYADVFARGSRALEQIARDYDGKTVVIGTHGGFIRALLHGFRLIPTEKLKVTPPVPNGSVTVAQYENGKLTLVQTGYTGHLTDKTTEEVLR